MSELFENLMKKYIREEMGEVTQILYEEGMEKGIEEGIVKGMQKGIEKGSQETKKEIAFTMKKDGFSDSKIASLLNVGINILQGWFSENPV